VKVGKNKLYVIAGERNMKAVKDLGGLYANVGQTTRTVYDRIKDKDYRLKSGAGTWKVIIEDTPLGKFEDAHIHELLRKRGDVKWDPESLNTEEFHFITDKGDGEEAKRIVKECLNNLRPHSIEKDIDIVKSKLQSAGVRHASEFHCEDIYWFRIRSFVDRVDSNGKTYLIINFINNTGDYKSIFCWAWRGEYPKIGSTFIAQVKKGKRSLATSFSKLKLIQNDLPAEVLEEVPGISDIGFFCNYDELIAYYEKEYKELIAYYEKEYKSKLDKHKSACAQSYQEKLIKVTAVKDKLWKNHYKHELGSTRGSLRQANERARKFQEAFTRSEARLSEARFKKGAFSIMAIAVIAMSFGLYNSQDGISTEHEEEQGPHQAAAWIHCNPGPGMGESKLPIEVNRPVQLESNTNTADRSPSSEVSHDGTDPGTSGCASVTIESNTNPACSGWPRARTHGCFTEDDLAFLNPRRVVMGLKPWDGFGRQVQLDKTKYKLEIEIRDRHSDPKLALREYNESR